MPEISLPTKAKQDDTNIKVTDIQTKATDTNNRVTDIQTKVTTISTNVKPSVIKSIQRGVAFTADAVKDITVSISVVAPNKCHVELYGNSDSSGRTPYVASLSNNTLVIRAGGQSGTNFNHDYYVSWEIIEYY